MDARSTTRNHDPSGDGRQTPKRTYSDIGQSSGDEGNDLDSESDVLRYGRTSRKGPKSRPPPSQWHSQGDFDDEITREEYLIGTEEEEREEDPEEQDEEGEDIAAYGNCRRMIIKSVNETRGIGPPCSQEKETYGPSLTHRAEVGGRLA